jgi:hypothetical protein
MNHGHRLKWVLLVFIASCAALLAWYFWAGRKEPVPERKAEEPANAPSRVSVQQGETVITLDQATQTRSGIVVSSITQGTYQEELQAYGTILDLQNIATFHKNLLDSRKNVADLNNSYATATALVEKSKVSAEASRKEYERLKTLYEDNRNISEKTLQAGEVAWRSDEANTQAALQGLRASQEALRTGEQSLDIFQNTIRQQWGSVIAEWILQGSSAFERLSQGMDFLIQVTLPSGISISSAPKSVRIQTNAGRTLSANLVSSSPRSDPRIQGMSFFYLAPSQPDILPGMNVLAYIPAGQMLRGLLVPASAIVWWQGKTWAYIQKDSNQFVRRQVITEFPVSEGWFVRRGLSKNDRIVTRGAELILSQEFSSQIETGG